MRNLRPRNTRPEAAGTDFAAQVTGGSRRRMKPLILAGVLTLSLLAVPFGIRAIVPHIGYSVICSQTPRPSDLILVLGGDFFGPRVLKAAELATAGYAPLVLISGPPYRGSPEGELAVDFLAGKGYPKGLFSVFGHTASSTVEEAIAVGQELRRRQVHSVILVTSAYHSRRADIVCRLFCGGIRFTSVPAPDSQYLPEQWWDDRQSRAIFISEWRKIIGSVLVAYPQHLFRQWAQR